MDENGRDDEKRHNRPYKVDESKMRCSWWRQFSQWHWLIMLQFRSCKNGDKDRTDAYGAKMSCKERLSPILNIGYEWFECHHNGNATEKKNKDGNNDETPRCHTECTVVVLCPGNNGAEVNKVSQVEQQVNNVGHM
uniref:Uncharacterized protein n=1 Tax=Photinus pyralis TaxID=7054 RepID=A0A1Y1K1F0_PHOPY